ncbi:MAG: hypothetical protein AB7G11_06175 [Phycisphaerales bacterium]
MIAIVVPTIGGTRWSAIDSASLSNLRSHAGVFSAYATDWKDRLPYFTDPTLPTTPVSNPARDYTVDSSYFSAHFNWPVALADPYYDGNHDSSVFFYPGGGRARPGLRDRVAISPYWYGCSFIATADYWNSRTRVAGITQLRPTSLSDAVFPADKMLMLEPYPAIQAVAPGPFKAGMAFLDSSAGREPVGFPQTDSLGDGDATQPYYHFNPWPPTMHSTNGIRGRDR